VNWDLRKAEQALARGEVAEARVHAWNALATIKPEELGTLLRIAEQCDDKLLILEIERRGVPARAQTDAKEASWPIFRLLFPIATVALLCIFALTSIPTEPSAPHPRASTPSAIPPARPILTEDGGIWIVQLGPSHFIRLPKLADDLTFRYRHPVGVLPELAALPEPAFEGRRDEAINGDIALDLLRKWYAARGPAAIIAITDYPMFSAELGLERPFLLRQVPNYAIVSTADLGANVISRIRGHTRYERTRKLVARAIGFLYLRRPASPDSHSLLRSQMSGTDDIDALVEKL
jgi:hypothetical protein